MINYEFWQEISQKRNYIFCKAGSYIAFLCANSIGFKYVTLHSSNANIEGKHEIVP
jgi:hypothetical protein